MEKGGGSVTRWYGSLQNRLYERTEQPEPEVGMGATEMWYSDRTPYEITEVIDERHIKVRQLDWKRKDDNGLSEIQEYEYASNVFMPQITLYKTKKGEWRERIGRNGLGGNRFVIGFAERYYDFSF